MTVVANTLDFLTHHEMLIVIGLFFWSWWWMNGMLGDIHDELKKSREVHTTFYGSIIKYLKQRDGER